MEISINRRAGSRELPPLILHPFNERATPSDLLENSKAALILNGLMPREGLDPDQLRHRLLRGRYSELRMLFFLGKDVFRWIDKCLEWSQGDGQPEEPGLTGQSFARLLVENPPQAVRDKLLRWGVADYNAIFARGIGINALFESPPEIEHLSGEFLNNYHRYADALYGAYLESQPHSIIGADRFDFDLYASGEYSRKLESEWGETSS